MGAMLSMCWMFNVETTSMFAPQILNVFMTFAMSAAGNVGVRQFVHDTTFGVSRQDGVHIHFFQNGSFCIRFACAERRLPFAEANSAIPLRP